MDPQAPAPKRGADPKSGRPSRRRALLFFLIAAFILAALLALNLALDNGWLARLTSPRQPAVTRAPISFYPADYEEDIEADEGYLGLNRYLRYTDGPYSTYLANERDLAAIGPVAYFFRAYFDAIIAGDSEAYNSFFTEEYRKEAGEKGRFTKQKVYDVELVKLSEYRPETEERLTVWEFDVSYRIRQNNGTFRDDIESDAARRQVYQLVRDDSDGKILIRSISDYKIK